MAINLPKISERTAIEATIGFYIGMIIGLIGIWWTIVFLMDYGFWFKFFVTISDVCIVGFQLVGLYQAIMQRRALLEFLSKKPLEVPPIPIDVMEQIKLAAKLSVGMAGPNDIKKVYDVEDIKKEFNEKSSLEA